MHKNVTLLQIDAKTRCGGSKLVRRDGIFYIHNIDQIVYIHNILLILILGEADVRNIFSTQMHARSEDAGEPKREWSIPKNTNCKSQLHKYTLFAAG